MSRAKPAIKIHGERVEMRPLAKIIPYEKNARQHSKAQLDALAAQITSAGFTSPLVVDEDGIILGGHGRLAAAKQIGLPALPCVVVRGLSEKKKRALRVADNSIALAATWDEALLSGELSALRGLGEDLISLGFDPLELGRLGVEGFDLPTRLEAAEETPPLPKKPVVSKGELWLLGDHRLLCGDSTSAADVERLMAGNLAQMIFTDPPYGVDYTGGMKKRERLVGDHVGTDIYAAALKNLAAAADDKAPLYLWYADGHVSAAAAAAAAAAAGYQIVAQIIWAKNHAQFMTSAHYKGKHEPCFYARRAGKSARWHGPNNEVTLWECDRSPRNDYHPTQKPVQLAQRAINNSSQRGDIVLDLFTGGGTTLIGAEMEGRKAFCMEINPAYGQVIIERWQNFVGKTAAREDGATLEDLKDGKTAKKVLRAIKTGKTKLVKAKL